MSKWTNNLEKENEELTFSGKREHKKTYEYPPYSHQRIKGVLKEWGYDMEWMNTGYKVSRIPGYKRKYRITESKTGQVVVEWVDLNSLRLFLAQHNVPLKKEDDIKYKVYEFYAFVQDVLLKGEKND